MQKISRALARRRRQSAIVSEMTITIFGAMNRAFARRKNFSGTFEKVLVAMAISRNDDAGGAPLNVASIVKILNIPRSNAKRATDDLIREGAIRREGAGFTLDLTYMKQRIDADYFKAMMAAIKKAAADLAS
jgi:hypothetical protein